MEDYEKANAREWDLHSKENKAPEASSSSWQVVTSAKKTEKPPRRSPPQKWQNAAGAVKDTKTNRPPPKFVTETMNEGHQSWRNREAPKASVRIPGELVLQDRTHNTIAQHHGAFIFTEQSKSNYGTMTYGIWGDNEAVEATKQAITAWVEEFMASKKSGRKVAKFAKLYSLTPPLWEQEEKRWQKEVKKHRFRQFPPPEMAFGAIGSFHWPVKEYRPEEILGMSYEALDAIRIECSCYVVFRKDRGVFQVMGKAEKVRAGLLRLRGTCFQIAARQISPLRLYLLHWPGASDFPSHVYLEPYEHPIVLPGDGLTDGKTGWSPRVHATISDDTRSEAQTGLSEERVRNCVIQTLSKLHYYNGSVQMRIRLGTFLATQYRQAKDGLYELDEYENMLTASQFIGHVTQELGDKGTERTAFTTIQNAGFFSAQDVMIGDVADIKPVYSAVLTLANEAGDFRLTKCWEEAQDKFSTLTAFEVISTKWVRLERDTNAASSILDISLSDLTTGKAFNFEITAAQPVEESRLSEALSDLDQSVGIDANEARKANNENSFITIKRYAPTLKSIQQRMSYRYRIGSSDYTLELTRFQNRTYPTRRSAFLPAAEPTVYEPRWGLSVYRNEWDSMFTQNERLAIGERANWSHDVDTWFPQDLSASEDEEKKGAGFGQLMEKLKVVGQLMMEAKEEDLMTDLVGGMTVG